MLGPRLGEAGKMTRFEYKATDEHGRIHDGTVDAVDRAAVEDILAGRGLRLVSMATIGERRSSLGPPLSDREVTELLDQLHALTRSGLPLPQGLRAASGELESPPLRATFARLADLLESGRGLDAALLQEASRFPAHLRGLALAGARTGRLADILGEVVQGSNLGQELRRRVWLAAAYPLLLLTIVLGMTCFICHLSTRVSEGITVDQQMFNLPPSSTAVAMYSLTQFIAAHDATMLLGLVVVGAVGFVWWRLGLGPSRRRRLLEAIPLLGPMLQFVALAEFCHLAALLVEADTPLPEALDLAGGSVRDASLAETCGRVAASVAAGHSLAGSLRLWTNLPAGLGQLLAWGEASGELAGALRFAGDMFEARADSQATYSSQVIGAVLLVAILWWIGFAIATIYLPLSYTIRLLALLNG